MHKQQLYRISMFVATLVIVLMPGSMQAVSQERSIVVVIPSYNNKDYYERNLGMLFSQKYDNYKVIYIDDASPDGTGDLVEAYVREQGQEERFTLVRNEVNQNEVANAYHAVHSCDDDDIIFLYHGDDWLAHDNVLSLINKLYSDSGVWSTHGLAQEYPSGKQMEWSDPYTKTEIAENKFREARWHASLMHTYRAWLFKAIKKEDLCYDESFMPRAGDVAVMFPILEMSGFHHCFISEMCYIWNRETPINEDKVDEEGQYHIELYLRSLSKYKPLREPVYSKE